MARADLWDADFVVTKPEIVTQRSAMHSIDVSTSELRQVFTNHALHPARELLPDAFIEQSARACGLTWRNRLFNPVVTLLACVYAHLGSVASLRVVEDWFNGFLPLIARRSDGSSLCRARRRLPLGLFRRCCRRVADVASGTGGLYAFGLRVLLADGTALRLGRSESVVRHFGCHAGSRGVSRRPIARAMLVCCAGTGAVLSWMMSPFIWAERRLLYRLLRDIGPGCLLVGDAGLFSYIVLSRLIRFGSHGLFRLPAWKTGCLSRKRLGNGDHLELWERPRREHSHFPKLLRREPAYLKVRVITCLLRRKGYRDRKLRLVVTLLNARACPASDILALYGRRWDIELDIRELKRSHLPEVLRGRTPDAVFREFASGVLAFSLTRALMAQAALLSSEPAEVRRLSHTRARRAIVEWAAMMREAECRRLLKIFRDLLTMMSRMTQPKQTRPPEPRAVIPIRRRYPPLATTRADWRATHAA
jgi:hypothetical protein